MKDIVWIIKTFQELSNEELYEILKIRQEIFVVEQTCDYLDADGLDYRAVHIFAKKNNQIITYCRVFDRGIKYPEASIGRVLTRKIFRDSSIGGTLVKFAINTIETRFKTTEIRISAQDYLIKFYSKFGFTDTKKKYLEDNIPHTEMLHAKKISE